MHKNIRNFIARLCFPGPRRTPVKRYRISPSVGCLEDFCITWVKTSSQWNEIEYNQSTESRRKKNPIHRNYGPHYLSREGKGDKYTREKRLGPGVHHKGRLENKGSRGCDGKVHSKESFFPWFHSKVRLGAGVIFYAGFGQHSLPFWPSTILEMIQQS